MLKNKLLILIVALLAFPAAATFVQNSEEENTEIGDYIIKVNNIRVRLEPSYQGKVTNTLHKAIKVYVYEFKSGWVDFPGY